MSPQWDGTINKVVQQKETGQAKATTKENIHKTKGHHRQRAHAHHIGQDVGMKCAEPNSYYMITYNDAHPAEGRRCATIA